jgi:hypothetical protein
MACVYSPYRGPCTADYIPTLLGLEEYTELFPPTWYQLGFPYLLSPPSSCSRRLRPFTDRRQHPLPSSPTPRLRPVPPLSSPWARVQLRHPLAWALPCCSVIPRRGRPPPLLRAPLLACALPRSCSSPGREWRTGGQPIPCFCGPPSAPHPGTGPLRCGHYRCSPTRGRDPRCCCYRGRRFGCTPRCTREAPDSHLRVTYRGSSWPAPPASGAAGLRYSAAAEAALVVALVEAQANTQP